MNHGESAVNRGLAKRESRPIEDLAIDETSFQKRHEYVTVVTDRNSGTIIEVLDDRKKATLKEWLEQNRGTGRQIGLDGYVGALHQRSAGDNRRGRGKDLL